MSDQSRRAFLKTGAIFGTLAGLLGFKPIARGQDESTAVPPSNPPSKPRTSFRTPSADDTELLRDVLGTPDDPYFPEAPPHINNGSVFSRRVMAPPRPIGKIPILQGATSQTETQFRILIKTNRAYRYSVIDAAGVKRAVAPRARGGVPTSQFAIDHVFVDKLLPGTTYTLEIEAVGVAGGNELRQFSTLNARSGAGDTLRVALISCQNDRYVDDQSEMWAAVAKSTPELMIFNGDSCYVDQRNDGTVEGLWDRQVQTREMLDVFKWDRLVPTLTTWDDHDTGENDADKFAPYISVARDNFSTMFKSDPVAGYNATAGLDFSFSAYGMRFILLDDRSDKTNGAMYSQTTEQWLKNEILTSPGPIWLVNGTQFFGGYLLGAESFEDTATQQLYRVMNMAKSAKAPTVLMSGDVHFSELMELEPALMGYKSYELCSSAIHSRTVPGQQYRSYNSRRLESTSRYNFMSIEMRSPEPTRVDFEVVCLGANDQEFFRMKATVKK
jgi:alkaline phosphatase D